MPGPSRKGGGAGGGAGATASTGDEVEQTPQATAATGAAEPTSATSPRPEGGDGSGSGSGGGDDEAEAPSATAGLSAEELAEFREIFNLVDKDGGGTISKDELGELMETLGINASQEEIDLMVHEVDDNNDGDIDFEEFVGVMSRKVNASYTPEQVKSAFKIFEGTAPTGHIKITDLMTALTTYGTTKLEEAAAAELVAQLEPDQNGLVNYVEYVNMMMAE